MAVDPKVIPFVFDQVTNLQTSVIEIGRYKYGSIWLPAGHTSANLTFSVGVNGTFGTLNGVSIASAAASNVYSMNSVLPFATQLKIISASGQDPTLTCYLILKD